MLNNKFESVIDKTNKQTKKNLQQQPNKSNVEDWNMSCSLGQSQMNTQKQLYPCYTYIFQISSRNENLVFICFTDQDCLVNTFEHWNIIFIQNYYEIYM